VSVCEVLAVCTTKKVVQAGDSRRRDGPAFTQTRELAWNRQMMVESAFVSCKACDCTLASSFPSLSTSGRETSRHLPGQARWKQPQAAQPSRTLISPNLLDRDRELQTANKRSKACLPIPTQHRRRIASFARAYKCPEQSYTLADCLAGQQRHPSDDTDAR
jgi:hypothetical protein